MPYSLCISFIEILKNEWLGLIASVFILISFLTSNQIKTRIINLVGCVIFIVYGIILPAYSTAFMNAAMIVVHAVFLIKHFKEKKKNRLLNDVAKDNDPEIEQNENIDKKDE